MVLYHALSAYQLLCCIEHKALFHPDEEGVLVLPTFIREKYPHYQELASSGLFDQVAIFNTVGFYDVRDFVLEELPGRVEQCLPLPAEEFSHVYLAGIHVYFCVYFAMNNIPFSMFEDGSGALSRPEVLLEINRRSIPAKTKIIEGFGLFDHTNPCIIRKYCNMNTQKEGFEDPLAEHFDIVENFGRLDADRQQAVRSFFRCQDREELDVASPAALILTQHFSNLLQLSFEHHVLIYQLLADYFLRDYNLLFKPHPDDVMYYGTLFPEAQFLTGRYPSELIPAVQEELPEAIVSISSTGTHMIADHFATRILFTPVYEKCFLSTHRYYAALNLAARLPGKELKTLGADANLVENLQLHAHIPRGESTQDGEKGVCWLVDVLNTLEGDTATAEEIRTLLAGLGPQDCALLLNSREDYLFYDVNNRERCAEMIPLQLHVRPTREKHCHVEEETQAIYFYSPGEVPEAVRQFALDWELPHTGAAISAAVLSGDRGRIATLEMQLRATEEELLRRIQSTKQLQEVLEEA